MIGGLPRAAEIGRHTGAGAFSSPAHLAGDVAPRLAPQLAPHTPAWRLALATPAVLVIIAVATSAMGAPASTKLLALLGVGAIAAQSKPRFARVIAVVVGAAALVLVNPVFSLYFLALVAALTATRRRALPFALVLAAGALLYPKFAFFRLYQHPGFWNWINEPSLALLLFVSALWWRTRLDMRLSASGPAGARSAGAEPDAGGFLLLFLFPTHAANPMVFSPALLSRPRRFDVGAIAALLGWFALKAAALVVLHRYAAGNYLRDLTEADARALTFIGSWRVVAVSYLETYLLLAATADIPILVARLYGWPLPDPFRAPLLAWNPVELWRRWGIYNRHLLLSLVYFPLGGNKRHPFFNIIMTFLASALLLHSGWFGSKYLIVGTGGWRDQSLYFLLQGVAVCACLASWRARRKDPRSDRELRFSAGRVLATVATQGYSALAHVIVLAQGMDLAARLRLIARCLIP